MPQVIFQNVDTTVYFTDDVRASLRDYLDTYTLDCKKPVTLHWNKSDTHTYSVVAVSSKQVGIDIEYMKERPFEKISRRYFHHMEVTKDKEWFYRLWTCKEACTKYKKERIADNVGEFMFTPNKWRRVVKHYDRLTEIPNLPDDVIGYIYT